MPLGLSWSDYNEALIRRGEILLDVDFVKDWSHELNGMNHPNKLGRPFEFPESYISFVAFLKIGFKLPYRMVQGAVRALSKVIKIEGMHFTHMRRRILAKKPSISMKVDETNQNEPMTLVVDSSGLSTTKKGAYIEKLWRKQKRKFVKLHIAVDKKTKKIAEFRVTGSKTADTKKFPPLVKDASKKNKITKVYADTAYDSRINFNLLDDMNIEPAIKVRKNSITKAKGSPLR